MSTRCYGCDKELSDNHNVNEPMCHECLYVVHELNKDLREEANTKEDNDA